MDLRDWTPAHAAQRRRAGDRPEQQLSIVPSSAQRGAATSIRFGLHLLLTAELQDSVIAHLQRWLLDNRFQGINVDFENVAADDYRLLEPFLERMRAAFVPHHLLISIDLEAASPLDWRRISDVCDFVIVMAYDEHSSTDKPGPIASVSCRAISCEEWPRESAKRSWWSAPAVTRTTGPKARRERRR